MSQPPLAVVTGSAAGIGAAVREDLIGRGWRVVGVDVAPPADDADCRRCDLGDPDQVQEVFTGIVRTEGPPTALVGCAGVISNRSFLDTELADFDRVMAINTRGMFFSSQILTRAMIEQGVRGNVVNFASAGAFMPPSDASYGMSKAAVVMLTKVMARELAPHGIRVNAVAPGSIDTPMGRAAREEVRARFLQQVPLGRFGQPAEMARSVAYLLSEDSSYMTGAVLNLSGGWMP